MADSEIERLEKSIVNLTSAVTALTANVAADHENIKKLGDALSMLTAEVEKHGNTLRKIELEAAKEEGRKQATGDLQAKLREHDEAAREVVALRKEQVEQADVVSKLKQAHDQQKGFLTAVGVILPVVISLLTAALSKAFGLG